MRDAVELLTTCRLRRSAGLSAGQVSQIRFANPPGFPVGSYAATILGTGEVALILDVPALVQQALKTRANRSPDSEDLGSSHHSSLADRATHPTLPA